MNAGGTEGLVWVNGIFRRQDAHTVEYSQILGIQQGTLLEDDRSLNFVRQHTLAFLCPSVYDIYEIEFSGQTYNISRNSLRYYVRSFWKVEKVLRDPSLHYHHQHLDALCKRAKGIQITIESSSCR